MDEKSDQRTESAADKRVYSAPVLQRWGTLKDLTRSMGHKGSKDGRQAGNEKRTSW